jgi:4a-hydroxytetrahydrobiopterin dehydratase
MPLLEQEEIERRLAGLDGWALDGAAITKDFDCGDFAGSVAFVNDLTPIAEDMNHHPDLAISWATVTVTITNHSAGGLTEADFELAGKIDARRG